MPDKDQLVTGYAQALFSVADAEGVLGSVEDELFAFAKALEQNAGLGQALTDPTLPIENKRGLIHDVMGELAHPLTAALLAFVVESGRSRELGRIVERLAALAAERRRHALAEVRAAVPLTDEQRARLTQALSEATGRSLEVKVVLDPNVVGGIVAHVGDEVFDGSIRTRLDEARQHLGSA